MALAIRLLFPGLYFLQTRLNNLKALVFHSYYEWIPNILLLYFFSQSNSLATSITQFVFGYVAFISIYEIGYLMNDHYATRFDSNPRERSATLNVTPGYSVVFIGLRLLTFFFCARYLNVIDDIKLYGFYFLLILVFVLHNIIKEKSFKVFTFINLALFRFFAPIYLHLDTDDLKLLFLPIFLCYVFFRTFIYLDSKSLLNMPEQKSSNFKLNFYLLLIPIHIWISISFNSIWPIYIIVYFLIFVFFFHVLGKKSSMLTNDSFK